MTHPYFDVPLPTVLGHRGAGGSAPENTLTAFGRGLELGAHIIESDVHATRDGVPVLLHDPILERTTDGQGAVADVTLAELERLDAGYRFEDAAGAHPFRGKGIKIPTLSGAWEAYPDARFNLEIKAEDAALVRRVVELTQSYGREAITLLTSGEDATMALLRGELARTGLRPAIGASLSDIVSVLQSALAGEKPTCDSMALQIPTDFAGQPLVRSELIEHCHAHDIAVHVWTINEPDEMARLLDLGVDGIVTDHPERLRALLETRASGAPRS